MKWPILSSFLFYILSAPGSLGNDHAIYISVIEINHDLEAKEASIQFKIFKDDLNDAVRNQYQEHHDIDSVQSVHYQMGISNYLIEHFILFINRNKVSFHSFTFNLEEDAVFVQARFKAQADWKQITIQSDLLLELFPTQQNIIHLKNGKENRFAKLSRKQQQIDFVF